MKDGFITFRSVTYAQRGEKILKRGGFDVALQRTPKWMEELGCGYCLRLAERELAQAVQVLSAQGVSFRKVYRRTADGRTEEVTL